MLTFFHDALERLAAGDVCLLRPLRILLCAREAACHAGMLARVCRGWNRQHTVRENLIMTALSLLGGGEEKRSDP